MSRPTEALVAGEKLWLFPQKFLVWEAQSLLVVSDCHFGKAGHFRKEGLAVPAINEVVQFEWLMDMARQLSVQKVLFLGDLFHSDWNHALSHLAPSLLAASNPELWLCLGNHDRFPQAFYSELGINKVENAFELGPFLFTHEQEVMQNRYNISGHVHPGIQLSGKGRQHLKVPCFYFSNFFGLMPAFGEFTGNHTIVPEKGDQVFAITTESVLPLANAQAITRRRSR